MDAKIERFTRGFFWFGYAVFLSASIPHIAAYFRHFDPATSGLANIFYWVIAVLLAVVIDVSDVLVSIAVMKAQANGAKFRDTSGFWVFILLIMALSWFFNWQYNVVYQTNEFRVVDKVAISLIWRHITVGQINPVIGSAFQLLLLVYTGMAHKFTQKPHEKSLEELQKEAEETQQRVTLQGQIDDAKRKQKTQQRAAFFDTLRQTKESVAGLVTNRESDTPNLDKAEMFFPDILSSESNEEAPEADSRGETVSSVVDSQELSSETVTPETVSSDRNSYTRNSFAPRNTDKLAPATKKRQLRATVGEDERRIRQHLKRHSGDNNTVISTKLGVSRTYVSSIRKKVEAETQQDDKEASHAGTK
jgi:hypothetical protein